MANVEAGILVKLRPHRYFHDKITKASHQGPHGRKPGDGAFRISQERWSRDQSLRVDERLFEAVPE